MARRERGKRRVRKIESIQPLTKEEVRERRKYFRDKSRRITKIYKGDKRVHGARTCGICGTRLSTVILSTGRTEATRDHYSFEMTDLYNVSACLDSRVCQRVHAKLRGGKQ